MALKPEFICLLRDIRDRVAPELKTLHDEVKTIYQDIQKIETNITQMEAQVELWKSEMETIRNEIHSISIGQVTTVPNKSDDTHGDASATYDPVTSKLNLAIPAGDKGPAGEITDVNAFGLGEGAHPTVENQGTPTSAILSFGIPKGDTGNGLHIKDTVLGVGNLPTSGNQAGDIYVIKDSGDMYVWGSDGEWTKMSIYDGTGLKESGSFDSFKYAIFENNLAIIMGEVSIPNEDWVEMQNLYGSTSGICYEKLKYLILTPFNYSMYPIHASASIYGRIDNIMTEVKPSKTNGKIALRIALRSVTIPSQNGEGDVGGDGDIPVTHPIKVNIFIAGKILG